MKIEFLEKKLSLDKKAYKNFKEKKLHDEDSQISISCMDTENSTDTVDMRAFLEMDEVQE